MRWAKREQEAFMKIKNSLLDNATLAYDEVGAETEVIVDASPVGLGAMLTQKKEICPEMHATTKMAKKRT